MRCRGFSMPPSSLSLRIGVDSAALCWRCSTRLARPRFQIRSVSKTATRPATVASSRFGYFLSNASVDRKLTPQSRHHGSDTVAPPAAEGDARPPTQPELASANPAILQQELPHRRRQAERAAARRKLAEESSEGTESDLPANASTILTDVAARQRSALRRHLSAFLSLTKPRLTTLVVLSAMASYSLYPVPSFLGPAAGALADVSAPSLSPLTLLFLTTGTALCSGAANTLNMLYETGTDAKMSRTRNRPLVRRLLSTRAAVLFAVGASVLGVASLHFGVNPTVAFLGAANIVLYAGVYTPMKRVSVVNTWVGALVGGIPPLMGWAAAAGESATGDGTFRELLFASDGSSIGGWLLAGLLFTWEFPHFMALSWTIREDYRTAGLRMLSWTNPARNARVALRYSLLFVPLCVALCATGVTEWTFAATSLPVNAWLAREAVRFWRSEGHGGAARGLFWASVWHLPAVMVLALLQKKGMWQRVWTSITGGPQALDGEDDDDGEWEYIADENDEVEASASTSAAAKVSTIPSPGVSSRAIR